MFIVLKCSCTIQKYYPFLRPYNFQYFGPILVFYLSMDSLKANVHLTIALMADSLPSKNNVFLKFRLQLLGNLIGESYKDSTILQQVCVL